VGRYGKILGNYDNYGKTYKIMGHLFTTLWLLTTVCKLENQAIGKSSCLSSN
jgi:hypothetical protein